MALKTTWKVLALILHFYIKYSKFCNIARFLNAPPQVHTKTLHTGTGSTEFRQRKVFEGVQYHVFDLLRKFNSGPQSYIESGPKVRIFQILVGPNIVWTTTLTQPSLFGPCISLLPRLQSSLRKKIARSRMGSKRGDMRRECTESLNLSAS